MLQRRQAGQRRGAAACARQAELLQRCQLQQRGHAIVAQAPAAAQVELLQAGRQRRQLLQGRAAQLDAALQRKLVQGVKGPQGRQPGGRDGRAGERH